MLDWGRLNANQRRAVEWNEGPLLVLAGPGSGKTLVLTMRVARLIQQNPNARFRILGLTFTTKAADEMRERVEELVGADARRTRLTTFHSFCAEVLRQHGSHIGLKPDFEILTLDEDRAAILDEAIASAGLEEAVKAEGKGVLRLVEYLFREAYTGLPDAVPPVAAEARAWVPRLFNAYIDTLLAKNRQDFGSLLHCTLRLLREQPRIAKHYRVVYPYLCVDEYQDTNCAQDFVLRALCDAGQRNLFVVADDDQIIYQWNGASPERLELLRTDYEMSVVQLPESYRCPPSVIELANRLIEHNLSRSSDKDQLVAVARTPKEDEIRIIHCESESDEAAWVAEDIRKRRLSPGSVAVLARTGKLLDVAAEALRQRGLDPYVVVRKREFETPAVAFVHAALRLARAPREREQLRRLCKGFHAMSQVDVRVEHVEAVAAMRGGALLRGFVELLDQSTVDREIRSNLIGPLRDCLVERMQYREFAEAVFKWCEGRRGQASDESVEFSDEEAEIGIWKDVSRDVRHQHGDEPTLGQFLQEMDLRPKTIEPKPDQVQCLTIHLAKGMEFENIYLLGLAEDQLPSFYAKQKGAQSRELEEERRNCFVAITRAQESLTLTFADSYFGWSKSPSRFLTEMGIALDAKE